MKSFGQTRKCWIDSAVCSTASGETVTAVLFGIFRDSRYRQGLQQQHRGNNLTSDDASCDKFGELATYCSQVSMGACSVGLPQTVK